MAAEIAAHWQQFDMSTFLASTHLIKRSSFPQFRLLGQLRVENLLMSLFDRPAAQGWASTQACVTGTQLELMGAAGAVLVVGFAVAVGFALGVATEALALGAVLLAEARSPSIEAEIESRPL